MQTTILIALLPALASAQTYLKLWKDQGCPDDAVKFDEYIELMLPDAGNANCQGGTTDLGDDWPTNDQGEFIVWVTGEGLGANCRAQLLRASPIESDTCGEAYITISGGTAGGCRQTTLPQNSGTDYCCDCVISKRDETLKRSNFRETIRARQDECSFEGGPVYQSRGTQEIVTNSASCPSAGDSCRIDIQHETSSSVTETFGVTTEAGASFLEILTASVSFSEDVATLEGQAYRLTNSITVPAGQSGFVTFTPSVECVDGVFSGSCDGWTVGEDGTACTPKFINPDTPSGTFAFVQEI